MDKGPGRPRGISESFAFLPKRPGSCGRNPRLYFQFLLATLQLSSTSGSSSRIRPWVDHVYLQGQSVGDLGIPPAARGRGAQEGGGGSSHTGATNPQNTPPIRHARLGRYGEKHGASTLRVGLTRVMSRSVGTSESVVRCHLDPFYVCANKEVDSSLRCPSKSQGPATHSIRPRGILLICYFWLWTPQDGQDGHLTSRPGHAEQQQGTSADPLATFHGELSLATCGHPWG